MSSLAGPAVRVEGVSKRYRGPGGSSVTAVVDASFTVDRGEIFGLLGANGAGKTTTLEIIEGLRAPTTGETYVHGFETRRDRRRAQQLIGVQLQSSSYFDHLTLAEILELFGSFYRRTVPAGALLESIGLADQRRRLVRTLSGGQARRFSIVAALVNDPAVVFLDEPTAGLDPQSRHSLWDLVRRIRDERATTVLLSTHYLEEASALCDRVLVMDQGRVRALGAPRQLVDRYGDGTCIRFRVNGLPAAELRELPGVLAVERAGGSYRLRVGAPERCLAGLLALARREGRDLPGLEVRPATLEDAFLNLTGRSVRD
jgi:ABC-2 type transport system ATP-binding protein